MARRSRKRLGQTVLAIILLLAVSLAGKLSFSGTPQHQSAGRPPATGGSTSITIEPQAGIAPVLDLIDNAKKSIELTMYELEDMQVEQSLAAAESRGVNVRVLLNKGYYGKPNKTNPNQTAYGYLQAHHVPVHWTPSYFALTHQKTLVVDGQNAFIMTFNLTPQYYATSRDFGVLDKDKADVSAIETTFAADWQAQKITAQTGDELLWSPGSETATVSLISGARSSLKIYNEEMADSKVVNALGAAAMRGVDVQIVMTDSSSWHANFTKLKNSGVHIRIYRADAPLYIHAKMIVVDNTRAFVGSENFSLTSLTRNRELGLILSDKGAITALNATFSSDYQNATPY